MKYDILVEQFKAYLQQLGYGKSTTQMLPELVKDFLGHAAKPNLEDIQTKDIQDFYEWLQIRPKKLSGAKSRLTERGIGTGGLSEQYIHHHIYALKTFFNWLETTNQIDHNPISIMKFKSPEGNPRQPLTQEEIRALFEAVETLKDIAILHLFYSCGLRRAEAVCLDIKDIHFKTKLLYVRQGKGAKRRVVPMTEKVKTDLENYYLQERIHRKNEYEQEAFVLNKIGRRMSGDSYNNVLKRLIERTGIPIAIGKEISLHYLRHSIATHLLESGLSVEYVRDFLGHAHLESTQIYVKVPHHLLKNL
jgi:integrase/recombinase XerD